MKKRITMPLSAEALRYFESLSKAALIDCLADALTVVLDDDDPETWTHAKVNEFCEPRLRLRGDRLPKKGV